jgi:hypothetical protein
VKPWQCQLALAITQTAFCIGSVYLKSSLRKVDSSDGHVFHPIIYAFLREATAGPIMCAMAWFTSGKTVFTGSALLHSLTAMQVHTFLKAGHIQVQGCCQHGRTYGGWQA